MLYRSFTSTGPKHEWNPMPCKLVIYCWHATLHFRCRATQVLELESVHPDDLQPGGGEDENLGSEIELGWKVCRESPNNWLPKSCLTSSFCWSTLVHCNACNNWYIYQLLQALHIRRFDQEPIQESTQLQLTVTHHDGWKQDRSKWIPMRSEFASTAAAP